MRRLSGSISFWNALINRRYDRCNFSGRLVHCVLINYPASGERDWDGIVTRISLSLRGD